MTLHLHPRAPSHRPPAALHRLLLHPSPSQTCLRCLRRLLPPPPLPPLPSRLRLTRRLPTVLSLRPTCKYLPRQRSHPPLLPRPLPLVRCLLLHRDHLQDEPLHLPAHRLALVCRAPVADGSLAGFKKATQQSAHDHWLYLQARTCERLVPRSVSCGLSALWSGAARTWFLLFVYSDLCTHLAQ